MRTSFIFPILALFTLIGSCSSCKHYCHNNPYPVVRFINFDSTDLNTVVITSTSTINGDPANPTTTKIYSSRKTLSGDTLSFGKVDTSSSEVILLDYNTDASIFIPATGKTYTIKQYTINRDSWDNVNCTNSMSYYLDNVLYTQPMQPTSNYEGFINITK